MTPASMASVSDPVVVDPVVVAVDLGTGGPKVALVALTGEIVASTHQRVEPLVGADGSAVQNPAQWWDAIEAGVADLVGAHPDAAERVVAVAVTGQWGSTVPVDASGHPVDDCMLWMDTRGRELAREALGGVVRVEGFGPRKIYEWIRRSGGAPSTEGNDPLGHRLYIERHRPDVFRRTARFVEPLDYVNACFTGRVAASPASMLLSWLTDNRDPRLVRYDPLLVRYARTSLAKLPPLLATGSVVGTVRPEVSARTGIGIGVPVLTALPDLLSATLGTGAVADYAGHLAISTSAWIGCHAPAKKTSIVKQMATVPAALPGRYVLANNHETAGVCAEWTRRLLVEADDGLTAPVATSLAALDAVAATSGPGAGGVLFTPWLNGERSPVADAALRGGFHGLSLSTSRADLVRAVLEGVAHNARWLLDASESFLGQSLGELRVIGGGAVSDVWCQIHADVLDRPLHRVADPLLANVRGAAFFAGVSLGHLEADAIPSLVRTERTFRPDASARAVHDAMHREFTKLPKAQRGMHRRLTAASRSG